MGNISLFKCKNCGAELDVRLAVNGVIECGYCHTPWTVPKQETASDAVKYLHDGNAALDVCKFEDAFTYFQKAAESDKNEPEAYFGMALAQFKVQYLKDEVNNCLQPICHEISEKVFTEDKNYKKALELATVEQKKVYRRKGGEIDDIREEFFALQNSGLTYNCFLCVKVTEEDGRTKTEDYNRANDIYYHLKDKGYKPFYSEREMKGRTGSAYEALILYALYTSECMLIVCSNEDYLQTKWVKNEYTRFIGMMTEGEKERDALTFVFAGKPIEKLPNGKKLQGINLARPDAYSLITEYVEKHTPEARKKRAEEEQKRLAQEEARAHAFEEQQKLLEEQKKELERLRSQSGFTQVGNLSDADLLAALHRAEEDRKAEIAQRKWYNISETECIGCGICASECPQDAISKSLYVAKGHKLPSYTINSNECDRCGECQKVCPVEAIHGVYVQSENDRKKAARLAKAQKEALAAHHTPEEEAKLREEAEAKRGRDLCFALSEIENDVLKKYKGKGGKVFVPDDIVSIGNGAFFNCSELTEIVFPDSLTTIGGSSFFRCTKLSHVELPNRVNSIGDNAFDGCVNLTTIKIPGSVTSIGNMAFRNCSHLTEIVIPESVTSIGDSAFKGCTMLKKLVIPDSVTSIGKGVIDGCVNLIDVSLPDRYSKLQAEANAQGVSATALDAFREATDEVMQKRREDEAIQRAYLAQFKIKDGCLIKYLGQGGKVVIPNSVTQVGARAFEGCTGLMGVHFPGGVNFIGECAFDGCIGLTEIELPASVSFIEVRAFEGCTGLTEIKFPENLTEIGDQAFKDCTALRTLVIPRNMTTIASEAFTGCIGLRSVTIPKRFDTGFLHSGLKTLFKSSYKNIQFTFI